MYRGSKFHRKSRLNVHNDLLVSSTKGITIADDARFTGAINLGVSFFIEPLTLTGNLLTKGSTVLTIAQLGIPTDLKKSILIDASGDWYINSIQQTSTKIKDWTVVGDIQIGQANNPQFSISHLVFFDKSITQKEVDFIHVNGGNFPATIHDSLVAHYPLTQNYPGFKLINED